jgi:hypothetical protein
MAMNMVLWVVEPRGLVGRYVSEKHTVSIVSAEDWSSMFLRIVGIYLQAHMALQPSRATPTVIALMPTVFRSVRSALTKYLHIQLMQYYSEPQWCAMLEKVLLSGRGREFKLLYSCNLQLGPLSCINFVEEQWKIVLKRLKSSGNYMYNLF